MAAGQITDALHDFVDDRDTGTMANCHSGGVVDVSDRDGAS